MSGAGQGQSLRVVAAKNSTYTLSEPGLLVALDSTSVVVVSPYIGKILVMGNDIRNSTSVQIFGSGFDTIYAGNSLSHMYSDKTVHPGGLSLMALDYGYRYLRKKYISSIICDFLLNHKMLNLLASR